MAELEMRDVSPGGHALSGAKVTGLPERATLREILHRRVHAEVAAYNADPGPVYVGLVQPEEAVRYSDGFRMREPRHLDADHLLTAVEEAVAAGVVVFHLGEERTTDLEHEVEVAATQEVVTELRRPIVARRET